MPRWNQPRPEDLESPWKTIIGAAGVFAFGFGCLVASYWLLRFALLIVQSYGGWDKALRVGRTNLPDYALFFWLALSGAALLVGTYCCWTGVHWFWVGVGAGTRGEMVDDDDPNTSPDNPDD